MRQDLWTPTEEWAGQDCYIIGGGPSLTTFDFTVLSGLNVLGCNDAFRLGVGIISYGVFGDAAYFHRNCREMESYRDAGMRFITCSPSLLSMKYPGLLKLHRERSALHPGSTVAWNYSTGAMAINVAINLGATRIYLLGYDLCNQGNKSHWHNHGRLTTRDTTFKKFTTGFQCVAAALPKNIQVFNVTDGSSKLNAFPRISFEDLLQHLTERKDEPDNPNAEADSHLLAAHGG